MNRRETIAALLLLGAGTRVPQAQAQEPGKIRVIGVLTPSARSSLREEVFLKGLRERGWVEGKNIRIEYRRAANNTEHLALMAQELVRFKVDVIVALSTPAALAAKNAAQTIPVVSISADPVGNRIVASFARPGGNITGISMMATQLVGKRIVLLKEIVPGLTRVAFLLYRKDSSHKTFAKEAEDAGRVLGIRLLPVIVSGPDEFEHAFALMQKERAGALIVQPLFVNLLGSAPRIIELAAKIRLPTVSDGDEFAEAGGLLFYGADPVAIYERIAYYVDRVLKGILPADLPVEQPTKFELVINLKTAKALGLKIPQSVLLRADRVIE